MDSPSVSFCVFSELVFETKRSTPGTVYSTVYNLIDGRQKKILTAVVGVSHGF